MAHSPEGYRSEFRGRCRRVMDNQLHSHKLLHTSCNSAGSLAIFVPTMEMISSTYLPFGYGMQVRQTSSYDGD
ncbi:hypothetical protein PIB30_047006 [Stylosanthes scabra]|uniref:Uncharacterized protein n=1 Tax=Stylosanthes scabra TaxID=79078 RepID=A0ABU6YHP1_9FABA|nr:hypothetical protein [Stylosanthes scabra]